MAPKEKVVGTRAQVVRPSISESSLVYVPNDALEGFEERIETGIDWTLTELGARHHRKKASKDLPTVTFSQAFEYKIKQSILGSFLDEASNISLEEQLDLIVATKLWDTEKFANEEGKRCFKNANCITDNLISLCKKAVRLNCRQVLMDELMNVEVLRITDAKMTALDEKILQFKKLISLNLCGNYIKDIDAALIPQTLRRLELQANHLSSVHTFAKSLPMDLLYLGLAKNLLKTACIEGLSLLPHNLTVVDLSDNDIYDLDPVLDAMLRLPNLVSLYLAGNPCSVSAGYAKMVLMTLRQLQWLDARKILSTDRTEEPCEMHPDDLRSAYFYFTVFRIMSAPQPPKPEKGATTAFYVELEIPLLDSFRRKFLMFRHNEDLREMLPPPEDEEPEIHAITSAVKSKAVIGKISKLENMEEAMSEESDIYQHMVPKNCREVINFTMFESNRIQWNKVMNFVEPTVRIFCPDLTTLRNTFRTVITIRLVYSVVQAKPAKVDKKSAHGGYNPPPGEQTVTICTVRCHLQNPDWSKPSQHFHWDDSLGTDDAIHWGDGDLAVLQYSQQPAKVTKGKVEDNIPSSRQQPPDNLTCHFGFGIETLRTGP